MTQLEYIEKHHEIERAISELKRTYGAQKEQEASRHKEAERNENDLHELNCRRIKAEYEEQIDVLHAQMHECKVERAKSKAEEEAAALNNQ